MAGRQAPPGRAAGVAADGGEHERVSPLRKLLCSVSAALCEEVARAATEELAERLEDSLLASQMQLGSPVPLQPHEGSLGALSAFSPSCGYLRRRRVGFLRHSFIAGFPTVPLSGVSTPLENLPGLPLRAWTAR